MRHVDDCNMSGLMDFWDGTHHDLDAMSSPDSWGKKRLRADCDVSFLQLC